MRYQELAIKKLDQLDNQLNGLKASFSNPKLTVYDLQNAIENIKEKVDEIRSLVNADTQD